MKINKKINHFLISYIPKQAVEKNNNKKLFPKTWLKGSYALETWNLYLHEGVTTNNYAEGYNSKLRHKKVLGLHPNCYLLASVIKDELGEAHDDGDSAAFGIEVHIIYNL